MLCFLLKEAPRKGQSVCFIGCVIPFSWFMEGNVLLLSVYLETAYIVEVENFLLKV